MDIFSNFLDASNGESVVIVVITVLAVTDAVVCGNVAVEISVVWLDVIVWCVVRCVIVEASHTIRKTCEWLVELSEMMLYYGHV